MRIICPSCHAAYDVPDALLAGGKAARCARCGTEWTPLPPPPSPSPPADGPPEEPQGAGRIEPQVAGYRPRRVDSLDDARPPPRDDETDLAPPRRGALLAWLVSLLVLAGLIWAAFAFRNEVMGAWPPSARLYAALGLR